MLKETLNASVIAISPVDVPQYREIESRSLNDIKGVTDNRSLNLNVPLLGISCFLRDIMDVRYPIFADCDGIHVQIQEITDSTTKCTLHDKCIPSTFQRRRDLGRKNRQ